MGELLLIPKLAGPFSVIVGLVLYLFPPKTINDAYGYRTKRSMKSQERWDFAQQYSALEMVKWGGALTVSSTLGFVINFSETIENFIGVGLMIIAYAMLVVKTERAIKQKFG